VDSVLNGFSRRVFSKIREETVNRPAVEPVSRAGIGQDAGYSRLSATIGSTFVARSAGMKQATIATSANEAANEERWFIRYPIRHALFSSSYGSVSKRMISLVVIAGMKAYDYESHPDFAAVPRAACVYSSSILKAVPLLVGDLCDYMRRLRLFL